MSSWLRCLHDDLHISTLFVTHDQEEALEVADRIVVGGRVITLGGSVRVELEGHACGVLEAELDRETWRDLKLNVGNGATAVLRALRVFPAQRT